MNVWGNVELSSEQIPLRCAYLEADALSMIRMAIKKFTDERREDFVAIAKELEELIIRQIESEYGLTRRYMMAISFCGLLTYIPEGMYNMRQRF